MLPTGGFIPRTLAISLGLLKTNDNQKYFEPFLDPTDTQDHTSPHSPTQ